MRLIKIAYRYLKRYPTLAAGVLCSVVIASFFEGVSFGMFIPLMQTLTNTGTNILEKAPVINRFGSILSSMDQTRMVSVIFILLFLMLTIKNLFTYLSNILIAKLRFGLVRNLSVIQMNKLIDYDTKYFDNVKIGTLITSISTETNRIGNMMRALLTFTANLGKVFAYIVLLFFISFKISALVLLLVIGILIPLELIMKKLKKLGVKVSEATREYNYKLTEIFNGIRVIKTFGAEEAEKRGFQDTADKIYRLSYTSNKYTYLLIPISEIILFGLIVASFLVLLNVVKINITNTFPFVATYLLVLTRALTQLNLLNSLRSEAVNNLAAVTNYEEINNEIGRMTIKSGDKIIRNFSRSIEFKNVSFSYTGKRLVLSNVNIKIPKGKITALVGVSGAGKSTVVNLISRFYDVNSGEIFIDGINIKDLDIKEWRKKMGFVSQDIFIFNASLKYNISYGRDDVSEEDIVEASKVAGVYDFLSYLPDGYCTVLGERGVMLSGGQKQRISIARAIIHNPEILVLDEATSSLDTETEKQITNAINKLTENRTVVAIAHRLSTILHSDNIVVLHDGMVAEQGTHADLIEKNRMYKKLYDNQFNMDKR